MTARDVPSTKPLLDKLGVKPGHRVSVVGLDDAAFVDLLRTRVDDLSVGRVKRSSDLIFLGLASTKDLARIGSVMRSLARDGALWTIRRKGGGVVSESATMQAGLDAGLVDVKVVSFSPTHTAEKFVFRLRDR